MNWESLYSARRSGDSPQKVPHRDAVRTSYIRDYDRIIFSSAFRRLQNKTQVFPLPGAVFVHNRLTHSLEVASVGRSLGRAVGDAIADLHFPDARIGSEADAHADFFRHELQSVIASACLAHDIGNPPFGHSGEDAIRGFFEGLDDASARQLKDQLSPNQWADFIHFEGNANALRVLTQQHNEPEAGGYKLTYATLASIVKYPCTSIEGFNRAAGRLSVKKSGFFDSERDLYQNITEVLDIPKLEGYNEVYARHPFVFLVEAADDICYRIIDLEDAHRLGILSLADFMGLFLPFFEQEPEGYNSISYVRKKLDNIVDANQQVQFIRAKWIGLMTEKLVQAFLIEEENLLNGRLERSLLECLSTETQALIKAINARSVETVYHHRSVVEIEVAGHHVLGGLLDAFLMAVLKPKLTRSAKLLQLIPRQNAVSGNNLYQDIQSVLDFISGMTDLYALDIYRKITGINIPEIR